MAHLLRFAFLIALLLPILAGCGGVQDLLDQLAGKPAAQDSAATVAQGTVSVPSGPQLFCISNIGHTLVVFSLTDKQVLPDTRRYLDLDPVGPWFAGGYGYYLNRVDSSGSGRNRLVEFLPKTAVERRALPFGTNTNPTDFLVLPSDPDVAWVTLRGATFDNFAARHVAVVRNLTHSGALTAQLSSLDNLTGDAGLTSPATMRWDATCPSNGGKPCVYLLVNNFGTGGIAAGTLLVLAPDAEGTPVLLTRVPLGLNPQDDMLLDSAAGRLWVVNNGGYPPGHQPGNLQALDTSTWATVATVADGTGAGGTVALVGIHAFDSATAWVTTYPADAVYSLPLTSPFPLNTAPGLPMLTGPLFHTLVPGAALYAGTGGYGAAHLAELDPAAGALLADHDLQSGNGPVSCAEYSVP